MNIANEKNSTVENKVSMTLEQCQELRGNGWFGDAFTGAFNVIGNTIGLTGNGNHSPIIPSDNS